MLLGILCLPVHIRLGQSVPPAWNVGTVDVQRDQAPDLQLLVPDPIFVGILVESVGNELDDEFLPTDDERGEEETKEQVGDEGQGGPRTGRLVTGVVVDAIEIEVEYHQLL